MDEASLPKIIISIERFGNTFNFHIIHEEGSLRYTSQVRTIENYNEARKLEEAILENKFDSLITYFQTKYELYHSKISFSYGAILREYITKEREVKRNESRPKYKSSR